jgi:hypothetical protein
MQGGCYVLGGNALKRIAKIVGLGAEDQENIAEAERVGEDVYIDTKCKVSKVPQRDTLRLRIWFRLDGTSLRLPHVRYQRDVLGVVAVHPVKKLDDLKTLLGEAV